MPISGLIINFVGEIFVDDTDLLNIMSEIINIEELIEVTHRRETSRNGQGS